MKDVTTKAMAIELRKIIKQHGIDKDPKVKKVADLVRRHKRYMPS